MRKVIGLIPGISFFIYFVATFDEIKLSILMGALAQSIAVGSIGYFYFNAPAGRHHTETAFGITGKYRNPIHGTIIPAKTAVIVIAMIILSCILGLIFNRYGY
ncbi:MAG: hypothetical protein HWE18_09945 [Gammaproteobacteria bacterium]|nr:hypothetical protein [Gammaproteobacteria bacterium]